MHLRVQVGVDRSPHTLAGLAEAGGPGVAGHIHVAGGRTHRLLGFDIHLLLAEQELVLARAAFAASKLQRRDPIQLVQLPFLVSPLPS